MTLSPDISGLRRRSPNPDSPHLDPNDSARPIQPYSPSLLSPYTRAEGSTQRLPSRYAPPRRSTSSLFSTYAPYGGTTPTIRLVPSRSEIPTPITLAPRSKSNDIDERSRDEPTSPALRRHETEPAYVRMERSSTVETLHLNTRNTQDRPLPPLPLHVRRNSVSGQSISSSILTTSSDAGRSELSAGISIDAASAGTGRRTWKSLLVNPFRDAPRRSLHDSFRSFGPVRIGSRAMSRLSRSATSVDSLIDTPYMLEKMARTTSEDTLVDKTLQRIRSTEGGDKILQKIPERLVEKGKEGWTSFKVVLFLSVLTLFGYGLAGLCWTMQIMLRISPNSDVTMVTDPDVVIFLLLFSLLALFTSFVGLTSTLLNSRPILAFYCLLLWPTFISLALIGYSSFKRANVQLDRKLNQVWSQFLSEEDRLRIQNGLGCCGYYNPFHDATYSKRCYPRTPLAGCKGKWTAFEDKALRSFARAAFSTVPIHLVNIVIALVCSNHVDVQFGKGLTPLRYRLQAADVRSNAMAVLAALPLIPKSSQPSSTPLKRRSALRSSRSSVRSSTSTVRLVDPYHQPKARQYSVDSMLEIYDKSPPIPFASRQKDQDAGNHRRATEGFGLPTAPTTRWSSLGYESSKVENNKREMKGNTRGT